MPIQRIPWEGHPFGEESLGPSGKAFLLCPPQRSNGLLWRIPSGRVYLAFPKAFLLCPKACLAFLKASLFCPKTCLAFPKASLLCPKACLASPKASLLCLKACLASPKAFLLCPKTCLAFPKASLLCPCQSNGLPGRIPLGKTHHSPKGVPSGKT